MRFLCAALAALMCLCAVAEAAPTLIITKTGYYLLDVGEDGVPVSTKVDNVIDYTNGSTPTPTPPAADSATVTKAAELAASINNPVALQAVGLAYKEIGEKVKVGTIGVEDAFPACKAAVEELERTLNLGNSLKTFRTGLGDYATPLLQDGQLSSRADVAQFLLDVSAGVMKAKPVEAAALSEEMKKLIITIIMTILQQFLNGGTTGVTPPVTLPGPF